MFSLPKHIKCLGKCITNFVVGDLKGQHQVFVGNKSDCECLITCIARNATGLTMENGGGELAGCWCELGETSIWNAHGSKFKCIMFGDDDQDL